MKYISLRTDDMLNGNGLRVVLFVSGCSHHCKGCHNPETWDMNNGEIFNDEAYERIIQELDKPHISGITFSGGDPLYPPNMSDIYKLICIIKKKYHSKTIWLYTGYKWEDIFLGNSQLRKEIVSLCDVVCDGVYIEELSDTNYPWAGSTNQRVIDVKKTLQSKKIVEWEGDF